MRTTANDLLFVYGTLKRGGELHDDLISEGAQFVGPARIRGDLFRIRGESYPGAVPSASGGYVRGELYQLASPSKALTRIDKLEGCDEGLFKRKRVDVWTRNGQTKAWAYFYARPLRTSRRLITGRFQTPSRRVARSR